MIPIMFSRSFNREVVQLPAMEADRSAEVKGLQPGKTAESEQVAGQMAPSGLLNRIYQISALL